jgi:hypothetical protein
VGRLDGKVLKEESAKGGGENKGEEEEEKMKEWVNALYSSRQRIGNNLNYYYVHNCRLCSINDCNFMLFVSGLLDNL